MNGMEIAVIGMSCRFPGASGIRAFWNNIAAGAETIAFFEGEDEDSQPDGSSSARHVRAGGVLEQIDGFDAEFFHYKKAEAREMDPQIRVLHECCWEALEDAGYDPFRYKQRIGIFTGAANNLYWQLLSLSSEASSDAELLDRSSLHDRSFASSRIAYSLNLRGPALTLDTACSTSLTTIHAACQALLGGECEMALAGGATITLPQTSGHEYQEGYIVSPDGHCRTFDDASQGTVWSNGAGTVLLKPLQEAIEDEDHIYAVIKATAINNDGVRKVGYTAPSVEGQAELIAVAHRIAGVEPDTIGLMEAHGTATRLGDPVEVEALRLAFRSPQTGYCALGSVKSLIGHADRAAGIAGFIKTVLALYHRKLPPTGQFKRPNAEIAFERSPFYINDRLRPWLADAPRRAAVNSLGVGGSNAYTILEEYLPEAGAPLANEEEQERDALILLSANSPLALRELARRLADRLADDKHCLPHQIAYTLYAGRRQLPFRQAFACSGRRQALRLLSHAATDSNGMCDRAAPETTPELYVFLGDGAGLAAPDRVGVCHYEPIFRTELLRCLEAIRQLAGLDLPLTPVAALTRRDTVLLGFAVQAASIKLLMAWGARPAAWHGSGTGRFAAAYLSGAVALQDALAQLVQELSEDDDGIALLSDDSDLAGISQLRQRLEDSRQRGVLLWLGDQGSDAADFAARTVQLPSGGCGDADLRVQLLHCAGELWCGGIALEAKVLFPEKGRVPLPTYPFERSSYWLEGDPREQWKGSRLAPQVTSGEELRGTPGHWLYYPSWAARSRRPSAAIAKDTSVLLVFCPDALETQGLLARLREDGYDAIRVGADDVDALQYRPKGDYSLCPLDERQLHQLLSELRDRGQTPTDVLYLWSAADESERDQRLPHTSILVQLVHALAALRPGASCRLRVVARQMLEVVGEDQSQPWLGTLAGLLPVVGQEYPNISCQLIDADRRALNGLTAGSEEGQRLYEELTAGTEDIESLAAYRNRKRWSLEYHRLEFAGAAVQSSAAAFRKGGTYWIIGGLGQIGLGIALHLARRYQARLILTSRTGLPDRAQWGTWLAHHPAEDPTARKISAIQAMEQYGAEVLLCPADAASMEDMAKAKECAEAAIGPLNGVIHAAVYPEITKLLAETDHDFIIRHWQAKAGALAVLEQLFRNERLDHIVLMSSLSSIIGGLGMGAYASANAWLDSWTTSLNAQGHPHWRCLNWDGWDTGQTDASVHAIGGLRPELSMEEGAAALELALFSGEPRIAVSLTDLSQRKARGEGPSFTDGSTAAADHGRLEQITAKPRPALSTPYVAIEGQQEQQIAAIWGRLLEMNGIGAEDHFFELGGDSLQAIQMIAALQKQLKLRVGLAEFMAQPTIRALARRLEDCSSEAEGLPLADARLPESSARAAQAHVEQAYPVSSAQRRMYVLHRLYPDSLQYNLPFAFRLEGRIDPDQVERCFDRLIERHESLRTAFGERDGNPVQLIDVEVAFAMERQALEARAVDPASEIDRILERFIRPFELTTAPLLRVCLLTIAPEEHILALDMHHIVSDGVTLKLLLSEFMQLYRGDQLPVPAWQYKDYSQWQHSPGRQSELQAAKRYWLGRFADPVPELKLPLDFPRRGEQGGQGDSIRFELTEDLTHRLKELARQQGATSFMLLLSLVYVWLYKASGNADVVIGTPVAGRTRTEYEHIAGLFLNYLPLRKRFDPGQTFSTLVREVTQETIEAFDCQEYPYDDLVEALRLPRSEGRNPLYDVIFIYQNVSIPDFALPNVAVSPYPYVHRSSKLDLNLEGMERSGRFHFILEYHSGLFREESIRTFVSQFIAIAERAAEDGLTTVQMVAGADLQAASRAITDFNDALEDE